MNEIPKKHRLLISDRMWYGGMIKTTNQKLSEANKACRTDSCHYQPVATSALEDRVQPCVDLVLLSL